MYSKTIMVSNSKYWVFRNRIFSVVFYYVSVYSESSTGYEKSKSTVQIVNNNPVSLCMSQKAFLSFYEKSTQLQCPLHLWCQMWPVLPLKSLLFFVQGLQFKLHHSFFFFFFFFQFISLGDCTVSWRQGPCFPPLSLNFCICLTDPRPIRRNLATSGENSTNFSSIDPTNFGKSWLHFWTTLPCDHMDQLHIWDNYL